MLELIIFAMVLAACLTMGMIGVIHYCMSEYFMAKMTKQWVKGMKIVSDTLDELSEDEGIE